MMGRCALTTLNRCTGYGSSPDLGIDEGLSQDIISPTRENCMNKNKQLRQGPSPAEATR